MGQHERLAQDRDAPRVLIGGLCTGVAMAMSMLSSNIREMQCDIWISFGNLMFDFSIDLGFLLQSKRLKSVFYQRPMKI